ncbi:hypothetical protein C475_03354 [Halosimplex carlsbadense 2-9-1]|uniref:Uncharacterized protein n=1 Tax=Halosimplex carlsbadense 2-9-1 TaxID=797114 RepID=M0D134_9EURY|nr:hypothetical protein C475_03354 [Halosimplex carlsbadense 2-9-1]
MTDGLAYGFRMVAAFGVLLTVAAVLSVVGVNMATTARTYGLYGEGTNWGQFSSVRPCRSRADLPCTPGRWGCCTK